MVSQRVGAAESLTERIPGKWTAEGIRKAILREYLMTEDSRDESGICWYPGKCPRYFSESKVAPRFEFQVVLDKSYELLSRTIFLFTQPYDKT